MLRSLKQLTVTCLFAYTALVAATPATAQLSPSEQSQVQACEHELSLAYRWNMMLVKDYFTDTVEVFGEVKPVPQVFLWPVGYFPHPTYKGGSTEAYNAIKPLAKQFHEQLSDEEKSCVIIYQGLNTNFGPLGALLEKLM